MAARESSLFSWSASERVGPREEKGEGRVRDSAHLDVVVEKEKLVQQSERKIRVLQTVHSYPSTRARTPAKEVANHAVVHVLLRNSHRHVQGQPTDISLTQSTIDRSAERQTDRAEKTFVSNTHTRALHVHVQTYMHYINTRQTRHPPQNLSDIGTRTECRSSTHALCSERRRDGAIREEKEEGKSSPYATD